MNGEKSGLQICIFLWCEQALILTRIFFICTALGFLFKTYGVVAVTHKDCEAALALPIDDFEDALVAVCAEKAGADYIVTRDEGFLGGDCPVISLKQTIYPDEKGIPGQAKWAFLCYAVSIGGAIQICSSICIMRSGKISEK